MVERLVDSGGDSLASVVLYGARAHGDYENDKDHFHLLIVLHDLDVASLKSVADPIRWWLKKKKPYPRILSPAVIRDGADVFPIEFLDIVSHHKVLVGEDPFAELAVGKDNLRIQCERELREKLMRVQEAYIEADGKAKHLKRLLLESYLSFAAIFRGCLQIGNGEVPTKTIDAVSLFCKRAGIELAPFEEIHQAASGKGGLDAPDALFVRYYESLQGAISAIDTLGFDPNDEDKGPNQ